MDNRRSEAHPGRMSFDMPEDLLAFLEGGEQLEYDASRCEAGRVLLKRRPDLSVGYAKALKGDESGHYIVPIVSLTATAQGYGPDGLLAWLPDERKLATVDVDHGKVSVFVGGKWSQVVDNPLRFLNGQWTGKGTKRYSAEYKCGFEPLEGGDGVPQKVLERGDPRHLRAWAEHFVAECRFQLAEPLFEGLLDGETGTGAHCRYGECALARGDRDEARARFERASQADPSDVLAWIYLGDLGSDEAWRRAASMGMGWQAAWRLALRRVFVSAEALPRLADTLARHGLRAEFMDQTWIRDELGLTMTLVLAQAR